MHMLLSMLWPAKQGEKERKEMIVCQLAHTKVNKTTIFHMVLTKPPRQDVIAKLMQIDFCKQDTKKKSKNQNDLPPPYACLGHNARKKRERCKYFTKLARTSQNQSSFFLSNGSRPTPSKPTKNLKLCPNKKKRRR